MTVGIVGAGQLGRMLALAGYPLGLDFLFLDRSAEVPAAALAPVLVGEFTDRALLRRLARRSEVLSFDWENISVPALRAATRGLRTRIAPPLRALATGQDRLAEKRLFERLGMRTTRYAAVDTRADLERACARIGMPGVLKTRRLGYDGRGQAVIRDRAGLEAGWRALGGVPLLYEELVDFECEVSALGVRGTRWQRSPLPADAQLARRRDPAPERRALEGARRSSARRDATMRAVLREFGYVGVLAIEFFVSDGTPGRQRARAARAQLRPLDHRGRGHQPVRKSPAGDRRARRSAAPQPLGHCGHGEPHRPHAAAQAAAGGARDCTCTTMANRRARGASSDTARWSRRAPANATSACEGCCAA